MANCEVEQKREEVTEITEIRRGCWVHPNVTYIVKVPVELVTRGEEKPSKNPDQITEGEPGDFKMPTCTQINIMEEVCGRELVPIEKLSHVQCPPFSEVVIEME